MDMATVPIMDTITMVIVITTDMDMSTAMRRGFTINNGELSLSLYHQIIFVISFQSDISNIQVYKLQENLTSFSLNITRNMTRNLKIPDQMIKYLHVA